MGRTDPRVGCYAASDRGWAITRGTSGSFRRNTHGTRFKVPVDLPTPDGRPGHLRSDT
jgi:hypothetical protein